MTLIECLHACNPWWDAPADETRLPARSRGEFAQMVKHLGGGKPLVLAGPRGAGKTTLLMQTVQYLIRLNVSPARILYFSGSDPALFIHSLHAQDVVLAYCAGVLGEEPEALSAAVYVLVDDAHSVRGLRLFMRRCREQGMRLHFIAAAPSVPLLFPPGSEALLAGVSVLHIQPLRLPQFWDFWCARADIPVDDARYRALLPDTNLLAQPADYVRALLERAHAFEFFRQEKTRALRACLFAGGYPAYFGTAGDAAAQAVRWQRQLYDGLLDAWLYSDVLSNYTVRFPGQLKQLLYYIASLDGREQAYASMARYLSLNTVTVMNHIQMFTQGGMAAVCEHYTQNRAGVLRKNKRFFLCDTGVKHALLHLCALSPGAFRRAARDAVLAMLFDEARARGGQVWYWRGGAGQIVYVLETDDILLPVQFVFDDAPERRQTAALRAFCRAAGCAAGIAVSEDVLEIQEPVCFVPLWML